MRSREIHLAARPEGEPTAETFRFVETDLPAPAEGQVLVRNTWMSVDPYMRGRMNDVKSYVPPFKLDECLSGATLGEVVQSNSPDLSPGDVVLHQYGWREYAVGKAKGFQKLDPAAAPSITAYLSVLGVTGLTAYVGLLDKAELREGDVVFVSGAAGAVGSVAGQIAKLRGASRVIGSAGSPAKVARLRELGFDAAFDYHDGPVRHRLREAAPDGIDVYFDNVGGEHLEAAISSLNDFGRVAACGMISQYNATRPDPAPRNLTMIVGKRLSIRGFIVTDHYALFPQFVTEVGGWLRDGRLTYDETVVEGLDNAPDAFLGVLRGENTGKMLVKL